MGTFLTIGTRALAYGSVAMVALIMMLTAADAGGRYFLNHPITGAYQITEDYLLVAAVFLYVAQAYRDGAYIRVTFLVERLSERARLVVNYAAQAFSGLCGMLLVWATAQQAWSLFVSGTTASGLMAYPLWPAYLLVLAGLSGMTLLMLCDLAHVRTGRSALLKDGSPDA